MALPMWMTSPSSSPDLKHTITLTTHFGILQTSLRKIRTHRLYKVGWQEIGHQKSIRWAILWAYITIFWHKTWSPHRPLCYTYWFWPASQSLSSLHAIITLPIKMQPVYNSLCILMRAGRSQRFPHCFTDSYHQCQGCYILYSYTSNQTRISLWCLHV